MQYNPIQNEGNKKVIVFFSGWGTDSSLFEHFEQEDYDVFTIFDYRNFDIKMPDFSKYEKKYLICWSMGVYVCNLFFEIFKDFDKKIAVNGTQKPIDDNYGIPELIYNLTVENFNEISCAKFMSKISSLGIFKDYRPRTTEELKEELISLRDLKIDKFINFDKAYVSIKDRIMPSKNQKNFWQTQNVPVTDIDAPHYIFDKFKKRSELL